MAKVKKLILPKNCISITEVKPPYKKLKDQRDDSYTLIARKELLAAFKSFGSVIVRIGTETAYMEHIIQPICYTLFKNGKLDKKKSQTIEDYNEYKQFLVDRFQKGQIFKLKEDGKAS